MIYILIGLWIVWMLHVAVWPAWWVRHTIATRKWWGRYIAEKKDKDDSGKA